MNTDEKPIKLEPVENTFHEDMSPFVFTLRTLIESIPFGLGPYGIGDAISLFEGIRGKMILGRRLDLLDRIISILAALIPVVPATPFREFAQQLRRKLQREYR